MSNPDDIMLWPDGEWCFREEIEECGSHRSDDYEIIQTSDPRWLELTQELDS